MLPFVGVLALSFVIFVSFKCHWLLKERIVVHRNCVNYLTIMVFWLRFSLCLLCEIAWVFHKVHYMSWWTVFAHRFSLVCELEVSHCLLMQQQQKKKQEKGKAHFLSLSVHMLILFLCKCANAICMSKCLIFHSVSILISSAVPLMEYWLLCYFILFLLLWCFLPCFWRGCTGTTEIAWMG